MNKVFFISLFLLNCFLSTAQQRQLLATKATTAPKLDGFLNDSVWKHAAIANNFIINQPQFGNPASEATEVKVIYTNEAVFIGAFLYDNPANIRKQLTARDAEMRQDVDFFSVSFDTYLDKQNAFMFGVTSTNVQTDNRISSNNTDGDRSWDAVWDSHIQMHANGWSVEMKIPYISLRFATSNVQDWGINFYRFMRRLNEGSYWNAVNPQTAGFVNQFGVLKGLVNLKPPLRLSFLPYITTGYSNIPTRNGTINTFIRNGGMDVKYGINESFTMDMTLIPDFGQVVSDNVILNLSPFEVQFQENRPFFTEGTELFNKANLFYSRRVGQTPTGYYDAKKIAADSNYVIEKNPSLTQLYNATKFSGRTNKNLGIGVFNAVTAPMKTVFKNDKGEKVIMETEPLANYNIIVLDQALKNRSSLTFTNTNVLRKGNSRNANVMGIDMDLFDKKNEYNINVSGRYSNIWGKESYSGFNSTLVASKVSGIWQWQVGNNIESDNYDPNDLGFLRAANEVSTFANVSFNQFTPNKHFNFRRYRFGISYESLYKPFVYTEFSYDASFLHIFKNFWDVRLEISGTPAKEHDYFELRTPNRMMQKLPWWFTGLFGSTDSRKKLFARFGFGYANLYQQNLPFFLYSFGLRYRFNDKLSIEANTNIEVDEGEFGFSHFNSVAEPIIGRRVVNRVTNVVNINYNFKARMNLAVRARHYWGKADYKNFYTVNTDGTWQQNQLPYTNGYDRNFNAFNIDAFYTWDFTPGSRFIVAWKNALGSDVFIDGTTNGNYGKNLQRTLASPQSNEVTVRFIYFIDYNSLKRKERK
jgi:Domain of unknown function (DUF5916)